MHDSEFLFSARAVAFRHDKELNAEYLVFAEFPNGNGRVLEVQRAIETDQQDVELGLTGYCVVVNRGVTAYDAIEEWGLEEDVLWFRVRAGTQAERSLPNSIQVVMPSPVAAAPVAAALARLVDNQIGPVQDFTFSIEDNLR